MRLAQATLPSAHRSQSCTQIKSQLASVTIRGKTFITVTTGDFVCRRHASLMISLLLFTQSYMYVLRASFRGAFTPLSQNLSPPLGTCEHCMRHESKTSDAPQTFNRQLVPPLASFSQRPLACPLPLCNQPLKVPRA